MRSRGCDSVLVRRLYESRAGAEPGRAASGGSPLRPLPARQRAASPFSGGRVRGGPWARLETLPLHLSGYLSRRKPGREGRSSSRERASPPGRVLEVSTCLARFKEPAEAEGSSASSLLGTLRGASHPLSGTRPSVPAGRPDASFFSCYCRANFALARLPSGTRRPNSELLLGASGTTLSGGSLGSCVDEERSQLRELM